MATFDYFPDTYSQARSKFLMTARAKRFALTHYVHPKLRGPKGEELAIDVAHTGKDDARYVLLIISGTHGVEGLCGSGLQVGYLQDELYGALPPKTATLLIHALNPFGFAYLRRVNEENVDLNRNFLDFSVAPPSSPAYESVHDYLVPQDWDTEQRRAADAELQKYMNSDRARSFQADVSRGQYTRPNGLFYGGLRPTWSNQVLHQLLSDNIWRTVERIIVLDLHTGLGPCGYGEPIYSGPIGAGLERARKWFGPEVTCTKDSTSTSADVAGSIAEAFQRGNFNDRVTFLSLEYGTLSMLEVLTALRADNWLHAVPNRTTPLRNSIKQQIRDAFYIDAPWWKAAVYGRFADFVLRASRAFSAS